MGKWRYFSSRKCQILSLYVKSMKNLCIFWFWFQILLQFYQSKMDLKIKATWKTWRTIFIFISKIQKSSISIKNICTSSVNVKKSVECINDSLSIDAFHLKSETNQPKNLLCIRSLCRIHRDDNSSTSYTRLLARNKTLHLRQCRAKFQGAYLWLPRKHVRARCYEGERENPFRESGNHDNCRRIFLAVHEPEGWEDRRW